MGAHYWCSLLGGEAGSCTVRFCDGDIGEGVRFANEVLYCPNGRAEDWGKADKRGKRPEDAEAVDGSDGSTAWDGEDDIDKLIEEYDSKPEACALGQGGVSFMLAKGHGEWPRDKKAKIIRGMKAACGYYNKYSDFERLLVAHYDPAVQSSTH